ncbi:MAG TPA: hypothetical protein VIY53_20275 [Acidobacteriaceae bacterium]
MKLVFSMCLMALAPVCARAQENFVANWQARAARTQNEQPHWVTPLATVTPRLEQEFRADFVRQIAPKLTDTWVFDNGKGLELIPADHVELLFNLPTYTEHNSATKDGWGDVSFLGKYRFLARNEQHGNAIITGFIGGSIPTGTYKNGQVNATVSPTLAAGKGYRRMDVQSTLGAQIPVASGEEYGRPISWNTALQYKIGPEKPGPRTPSLWPEVEFNTTYYKGGDHDGKTQNFVTPGVICRFPLHKRLGFVLGVGMQIATTQFHSYNHGLLLSARMPF